MQDASTIKLLKANMLSKIGDNGRGQRAAQTADVLCIGRHNDNGFDSVRVAFNNTSAKLKNALGGTGLKTMLVGYKDALSVQASESNSFSGKTVTKLYETDNNNYRYTNYTGTSVATNCLSVINAVLKGMNISLSFIDVGFGTVEKCIGKTGYCNYRCSGDTSGLRYANVYYLEFQKFDSALDSYHTMTVGTCTNGSLSTDINATHYGRLTKGEVVCVTPKPASGYQAESVTVTDTAAGAAVAVRFENGGYYFTMPGGDVTVSATFTAK